MNLKARTLTAIGRAMPRPLLLKLIGDEWHEEIVMSVYKAMKQVERDAHRSAIRSAANVVCKHIDGGYRHPAFEAVMALEKKR